jgi:hypothetical protein
VFAGLRPDDARAHRRFLGRSPGGGWLTPALTAHLLACHGIAQVSAEPVTSEQTAVFGLGGIATDVLPTPTRPR